MKYWLLTTEYPPFFGGGIGTYSRITASMMSTKGHEVSVFVNDASVKDFRIEQKSKLLRIIRFNPSRTNSSNFLGYVTNTSYEFAHIVKHFIEREGPPEVIEAQEYQGIAYYLLQYKHLQYDWCKHIPIIITMHSPSFLYMEYNHVVGYKYPNYWICEMERFCLQAADLLISPSHFMLRELKKRFQLANSNVTVVPNPFIAESFQTASNISNHQGEIVFYGKLTVQKGILYLLKYFKELWDEGFSRPLYLLGSADIIYHAEQKSMGDFIKTKYKKYIQRGLLVLEGKIRPTELTSRLSKAEVVIIPSANDNLPYTVFEMMALGKILLVSKQGGQFEVIEDSKDGFVFDHENPESFSIRLKQIISLSPEERNAVSNNAKQKVKVRYHPESIYAIKYKEIENIIRGNHVKNRFPFVRGMQENIFTTTPKPPTTPNLLSIVIPYYNMGLYIEETVTSVLESDYGQKEIIIINDGSSDNNSLQKLDGFRNNENIRILDTPNKGLAQARNFGAATAKGEFLAFLDADDKVHKTYYSKAVKVLRQYDNVNFVGCWTRYFEHSENIWPAFTPEPPLILYHNTINTSALVYKRETFLQSGRNDSKMMFQGLEDYESVISILSSGYNGVVLPEPLFFYRVRPDSMIREISSNKKLLLHQYAAEKHKQFYATFATEVFGLQNANGPGIFVDNPTLDYHLAEKIPFAGGFSRKLVYLIKRNQLTRMIAYKLYRLLNK